MNKTLQDSVGVGLNEGKKVFFPHLDALRFLAFLIVFVSHVAVFLVFNFSNPTYQFIRKAFLVHGDLGVTFFFVLSGFLITTLLFFERDAKGSISILKFYARRILRIWPVYFITLVGGFFLIPLLSKFLMGLGLSVQDIYNVDRTKIFWYVFFAGNFSLAYHTYISPVVAILWSIAVEEQFYIVWPLLLTISYKVFKKRPERVIVIGLTALVVYSFIYRFVNLENIKVVKYTTQAVISDLAIGTLIAFFVKKVTSERLGLYLKRSTNIFVYVLGFIFVISRNFIGTGSGLFGSIYEASETLIFSLISAYIILEQNYSSASIFKFSKVTVLNYFGRISYGLYAYHMIVIYIVSTFFANLMDWLGLAGDTSVLSIKSVFLYGFAPVLAFVLTLVLAHISYRYIEKKVLKLKERMV